MSVLRFSWAIVAAISFSAGSANAAVIYDGIPSPDPTASPSLGFQATSTKEFGDRIAFGGTDRTLTSVRLGLVSWAEQGTTYTDPNLVSSSSGWMQEISFNVYDLSLNLLATVTDTFLLPWYSGTGSRPFAAVTFDFSSLAVELPDEIIYGVQFNTGTYGEAPTGFSGPYNSLNVAVGGNGNGNVGEYIPPTVGTDVNPDSLYWNTSVGGFYADGGVGGVGVFREDTAWGPYTPMVEFNATTVPEPGSVLLLGMGIAGLAAMRRRRQIAA